MREVTVKQCRECGESFTPKGGKSKHRQLICGHKCRKVRANRARAAWKASPVGVRWWRERNSRDRAKRKAAHA